jgi:DNA-binding MarR family transcriptional regulator
MNFRGKTSTDDLNFYALLAVLQSGMWLQSDIESYLRGYKLSHGRFSILLSIVEAEDKTLIGNDLAVLLGVGKPTIARMVDRLIDEEYLMVAVDKDDLRKKRYLLTGKARALIAKIIPGYLRRLRVISADLTDDEKAHLIKILAKMNYLDPRKTILRRKERGITEKSMEIRTLRRRGHDKDIDRVMEFLNEDADLSTTKVVDFYLGTVDNVHGLRRIEHYLFHGTQMQRNYCTLFFARRDEWRIVNRAFTMGLIDRVQAYSR